MILEIIVILFVSYFLGSVPSGIIYTKLFSLGDLKEIGSGSIGTTNVLRTGSYTAAALTLMTDFIKSYSAMQLTFLINEKYFLLSALAILIGHIFPLWLKFKGGKGFASYLGIVFSMSFFLFIIIISIWIVVFLIKRISSLAALISSIIAVLCSIFIFNLYHFDLTLLTLIIYLTHFDNIKRLYLGTESKI